MILPIGKNSRLVKSLPGAITKVTKHSPSIMSCFGRFIGQSQLIKSQCTCVYSYLILFPFLHRLFDLII